MLRIHNFLPAELAKEARKDRSYLTLNGGRGGWYETGIQISLHFQSRDSVLNLYF